MKIVAVDLDALEMAGNKMVRRVLEKWLESHPVNEVVIREDDEWIVKLERKQKSSSKQ